MKCKIKSLKELSLIVLCAILGVLVGCSSVPAQVNKGAIPARTFTFMDMKAKSSAGMADNRAEMHAMIQNAITKNLAAKGISKVENGGDITVGYLVIVASNTTTSAISDYFGYGPDNKALINKAHKRVDKIRDEDPATRIRDPKTYRSGALVIDVLDTKTSILKYRNLAYSEILAEASEELRIKRLQAAVDVILADFKVETLR